MHWIIQKGFENDYAVRDLIDSLERLDVPYSMVQVYPFAGDIHQPDAVLLERDVDLNNVMLYGSITLTKIGLARGWGPGIFTNENFNYKTVVENWNSRCLNHDCVFTDFVHGGIEAYKFSNSGKDKFFVRPMLDDKSFSGQVMSYQEFSEWSNKIWNLEASGDFTSIPVSTGIVLSKLKPIESEYRFIVVDGRIVTGSMYKRGDTVIHSREIDRQVSYFASVTASEDLIHLNRWNPARAYMLDICMSNGEPKVLEIGGINSCGLYACDTREFVAAIEGMIF